MSELRGLHFRTESGTDYYYDDWSGLCYPCPTKLKQTLKKLQHSEPDALLSKREPNRWEHFILKRHQAYGAFFGKSFSETDNPRPAPDHLAEVIADNGMRQLYLVVTDDCNLRCKYCIYSEHYPSQKQANTRMDFDTAKAAIDFYLSSLNKKRKHTPAAPAIINFYGGEPLMNFRLIKQVVEYVNEFGFQNVVYSLTTNAVLLRNENADFLVKHDFTIAVSIDGPQSEHDRNRIFPNGKGSFNTVYENIKNFCERHPEHRHLLFLVTFDLLSDLENIRQFFSAGFFTKYPFFFSRVKDSFTDYYDQFSAEDVERFTQASTELGQKALADATTDDPTVKYGAAVPYVFLLMRKILATRGNPFIPATGSCIPGEKLCVLTNGTYQPCERVPGLTEMGSVRTGLDYERIADLVQSYNDKITRHCAHCPIQRLCSFCYLHFWSGVSFEKPFAGLCEDQVDRIRLQLSRFFSMLEADRSLYEVFMHRNDQQHRRLRTLVS